jgi:hypothetical protein
VCFVLLRQYSCWICVFVSLWVFLIGSEILKIVNTHLVNTHNFFEKFQNLPNLNFKKKIIMEDAPGLCMEDAYGLLY